MTAFFGHELGRDGSTDVWLGRFEGGWIRRADRQYEAEVENRATPLDYSAAGSSAMSGPASGPPASPELAAPNP